MSVPFSPVDIAAPMFKANPYPVLKAWRAETPILQVRVRGPAAGAAEAFLVTRYADISAMLKDRRLVKQPGNAGLPDPKAPAFVRPLMRNMLALDEPDHGRLKRLVQSAFSPRRIERMRTTTETVSNALIDRLPLGTPFDLMRHYALPLPVAVISEMLGVPEADRLRFARWSGALIRGAGSRWDMVTAMPDILAFLRYLKRFITAKRARPGDDLVSDLIREEIEGDRLDSEELMAMVAILLNAGHETTAGLIGNGILALIDDPVAAAEWQAGPANPDMAIEEMLRFAGPVLSSTHRYASEELEIAGSRIPRGALVLGMIASANRDETVFEAADCLILDRTPNRHLTFGEGGHYCVGASLARMEGQIAIRHLITRLPKLRLAGDRRQLAYRKGLILSAPMQCHVVAG